MKRLWILVVVALVAIFGGRAWYLNKNKSEDTNTIKIGAVLPLTGTVPEDGKMTQNAMMEAIDKFNQNSGIKIKLSVEDGKFTAKDSINAFHKLRSKGIDLIFVYGDVPTNAISPIAKENNIPIYACACRTVQYGVNVFPDTPYLIDYMTNFVKNDLKAKTVAVFYIKGIEPEVMANHFKKRLSESNISIVKEEPYSDTSTDARSMVSKVLQEKPEVIAIFGWGPFYPVLLNTIREQGFTGPIVSDWNITTYKNVIKGTNYPLFWTDTLFDIESTNPELKAFVEYFQNKYNHVPSTFAMMNYISVQIIANAIKNKNYKIENVYQNILNTKDFPSILGPISIGENRHMRLPLAIKQMQPDGTAKIIKE